MKCSATTDDLSLQPTVTTTHLPQTMIESRYRQFATCSSKTLDALDLDVTKEQIARATALVNAPIGIPLMRDKRAVYKVIIQHFVALIASKSSLKLTQEDISNHFKSWMMGDLRADQLLDFIPTDNQNYIAVRIWMQIKNTHPANLVSRVLILRISQKEPAITQPIIFFKTFGNVDLCLLPESIILTREASKLQKMVFSSLDNIKTFLSRDDFITVAHYLDHGQTFNLSTLKQLGFDDLSDIEVTLKNLWQPVDPYQQYLNDISDYVHTTFNGTLITRRLPETFQLLHLTHHKRPIITSKQLRVSLAGCIGNMVYTTMLVGDDYNVIGGHTIGLCNRLSCLPSNDNLILLELEQSGNIITNWIEKLGRGRLFLEARNRMLSTGTYKNSVNRLQFTLSNSSDFRLHAFQIKTLSTQAIEMYRRCWDILIFCINYSQIVRGSKPNPSALERWFTKLSSLLSKASQEVNGESYYSILNSIVFETVKDYILLFQSNSDSKRYRDVHSFNMHMQYQIFFELFPQLKTDWNTSLFPMNVPHVFNTLERWGFFMHDNDKHLFREFFLNRFAYYINVGGLEGIKKLPIIDKNTSFDSLSNQLPNLMGNIFNMIIKQYKKSSILERYMRQLRSCYALSYDTRDIHIAIKSGVCGTEEIGVRPRSDIGFFDVAISKKEELFTVSKTTPLNLTMGGASDRKGFTDRGSLTKHITLESLNDPSYNLSFIAQSILEQFYLKSFRPHAVDRSQDTKHFEVTSHKIPRVTHGALHAARVMLYVKMIHHFRLEQQDPKIFELRDLSNSLNISSSILLHLTQIAAVFHDSGRLDEGSDRWDKESAIHCLTFLVTNIIGLASNIAQIIANTIAFKDDEQAFLAAGEALGFTAQQMNQFNYLRQLVHDADCLDIMRVKSTFKTNFLDMKASVRQEELIHFVKTILELINMQYDQYKPCTIQHHGMNYPIVGAAFNIDHKCTYEWSPNIIEAVIKDVVKFPSLHQLLRPWSMESLQAQTRMMSLA